VPASTSYFFGFTAAYTGYELFHYSLHARAPSTAFGHWLRKHHFAHHYHHPQFNHGVTSPIWDWVFGTLKTVPVIHVPNKFVQESMPWLIDAETGEVKDAYQSDYVIRRRK
jgi:sterol desaturase/sphingolipid hydroxylase (fatty acid hydroxylase superfamily)